MRNSTRRLFQELLERYPDLNSCGDEIEQMIEALLDSFRQGGKLLVCGNGGSAADGEHIVGELMKSFMLPRKLEMEKQQKLRDLFPEDASTMIDCLQQAVPAISLASQTALMTAFGNDVSSQMVFAQQVLGYGRPGDVLLAISTSGNSANVIYAAKVAKLQDVKVVSLTGSTGGKLKDYSDLTICAPSDITYKIQEYHLPIYHCMCACVENELFGEK